MNVENHLKIVEDALKKKPECGCVAMDINITELARSTGKLTTVNFKYAYYLSNILNRILSKGFDTIWDDELGFGVWIRHEQFLGQIDFLSITKETLRCDLMFLRDRGLLKSKPKNRDMLRKEYYFIDVNGFNIFSKEKLEKYKNKLEKRGGK